MCYQISLLRAEIKEVKQLFTSSQNFNQQYSGIQRPIPIIYPTNPNQQYIQTNYPGQPMPTYQHQVFCNKSNN